MKKKCSWCGKVTDVTEIVEMDEYEEVISKKLLCVDCIKKYRESSSNNEESMEIEDIEERNV
jgi:hypothetical protein